MMRAILQRIASVLILNALFVGLLLLGAGTASWTLAWAYLGLTMVLFVLNLVYVLRVNPEVIVARSQVGEGTKGYEKVFGLVFGLAVLGMHLVAGLQAVRWGDGQAEPALVAIGAALLVLGDVPIAWAMGTNPHLEKTVRIQEDRNHRVISEGPYALVRHPMYVGIILQYIGIPLFFGSWWSGVAAAAALLALVVRTSYEDQTLRDELAGYADYAKHTTRYRLVPGVW